MMKIEQLLPKFLWNTIVSFQNNSVVSSLSKFSQQLVIFSSCLGDKTTSENIIFTDLFISDLIQSGYSYFPVYLYDGQEIKNIFLIIYNLSATNKSFRAMVDYIDKQSVLYDVTLFYTKENGQFYIHQDEEKIPSLYKDFTSVMMMLSEHNGIDTENCYLTMNPLPQ